MKLRLVLLFPRRRVSLLALSMLVLLSHSGSPASAASLPKTLSLRIKSLATIPRGGASTLWTSTAPLQEQHQEIVWKNDRSTTKTELSSATRTGLASVTHRLADPKVASLTLFSVFSVYLLYAQRAVWLPLLNKDTIQRNTLNLLSRLQPEDAVAANALISKPLLMYAGGMAVWELLGLSTIPVESAAGMVFGWKGGIYSAAGKFVGAITAFAIGRYLIAEQVSEKFQNNELFQLVNAKPTGNMAEHVHPPLMTAFLMKFSCFPELVKNFGSSLLPVISPWMFALATAVHGGGFSMLWTWLGVDTAGKLEAASSVSSGGGARIAVLVAAFVGVVLTPMLMAWWVRDLKRLAAERRAK
jgi:uncharacterized membrane protein YdjX (TVP38/TMEM64 family)